MHRLKREGLISRACRVLCRFAQDVCGSLGNREENRAGEQPWKLIKSQNHSSHNHELRIHQTNCEQT